MYADDGPKVDLGKPRPALRNEDWTAALRASVEKALMVMITFAEMGSERASTSNDDQHGGWMTICTGTIVASDGTGDVCYM